MQQDIALLTKRVADLEKRVKALEESDTPPDLGGEDPIIQKVITVIEDQRYEFVSASLIQRRFAVGYARAARILDQLEEAGMVGPGEGAKPRKVLKRKDA